MVLHSGLSFSHILLLDTDSPIQAQIIRCSNLLISVVLLIIYVKAYMKVRQSDIRDKIIFNVSFVKVISDFFREVFFNSFYILLIGRFLDVFLECSLSLILAEIMILKRQKNQDEVITSHLKQHVRSRKLLRIFNGLVLIFFVVYVALVIYDLNAEESVITVPSNLWMIFSIISIGITSISLCLILCLTEEDRK